jgi:hypothetical protein
MGPVQRCFVAVTDLKHPIVTKDVGVLLVSGKLPVITNKWCQN